MTKEELGLPWKISGCGCVTSSDKYHIADMNEDTAKEMNFILKAVNNHHALVEALEKLHEIMRIHKNLLIAEEINSVLEKAK